MHTFKNFNIADWFSFYRIAAVPVLLLLLWLGERQMFTWFLLISYSTDMIDGFLARRLNITSPRGSQLDSLGDQVTFAIGITGLIIFEYAFIKANYILIFIALFPYLLQMLIAYRKYGKATAFHTYLAKLSALLQGIFILWSLFFHPVYPLFYIMLVFGILETLEEIILIFMHKEWRSDVKGIYWALQQRRRRARTNYKI